MFLINNLSNFDTGLSKFIITIFIKIYDFFFSIIDVTIWALLNEHQLN